MRPRRGGCIQTALLCFAAFFLGICTGSGLILLGIAFHDQRKLRLPLELVNAPSRSAGDTTAQIPPSPLSFEPVYLSDAQVATMERVKSGTAPRSHDTVEADRVGSY